MKKITYGQFYTEARKTLTALAPSGTRLFVSADGGKTARVSEEYGAVEVHLPTIAPETLLSEADADRYLAFAIHELAHILHSKLGALRGLPDDVRNLANALEDARIEAKEIGRGKHHGVRGLFSGLADHIAARSGAVKWGELTPAARLAWASALGCRADTGHYHDAPSLLSVVSSIPEDIARLVSEASRRLKSCRSSADTVALAQDLLNQQQQQQQQQQQKGDDQKGDDQQGDDQQGSDRGDQKGDQKGDAQQGNQQGDQKGDAQQGNDQQGSDRGAQQGNDRGDQKGDDQKGGKRAGGSGAANGGTPDVSKMMSAAGAVAEASKALGAMDEKSLDRATEDEKLRFLGSRNLLSVIAVAAGHLQYPWTTQVGPACWAQLLARPAKMRDQLRRMLRATETVATIRREMSGRLDPRAMMRAQWGEPDVFSRKHRTDGIETDVLLLIDLSGSMNEPMSGARRIDYAKAFALNLGDACLNAGAAVKIVGFSTYNPGCGGGWAVFKDWSDRGPAWREKVASAQPNGGTRLTDEIVAAGIELSKRRAQRSIVLALTDGECSYGKNTVRAACDYVRKTYGVEVGGIGCACDVSDAFPTFQNVFDPKEIAERGLDVLVKAFEKGARR